MSLARTGPEVLLDLDECLAGVSPDQGGALWRLAEPVRQLDANVVRLPAGNALAEHVEPDLDVLVLVLAGSGWLGGGEGRRPLAAGSVVWLPRGAARGFRAGPEGLVHLTVHPRRPGMTIKSPSGPPVERPTPVVAEGGEAPCLLDLVCPACDHVRAERSARFCSRCGNALPSTGSSPPCRRRASGAPSGAHADGLPGGGWSARRAQRRRQLTWPSPACARPHRTKARPDRHPPQPRGPRANGSSTLPGLLGHGPPLPGWVPRPERSQPPPLRS